MPTADFRIKAVPGFRAGNLKRLQRPGAGQKRAVLN